MSTCISGADPPDETDLGLVWGVKDSFMNYLANLPDIQTSASHGARALRGRRYFFSRERSDTADLTARRGVAQFRGDVRFSGHFGMLFVILKDPWISMDGRHALLTVADPDHYPDSRRRLPLLDLELELELSDASVPTRPGHPLRWTSTLRVEATKHFNGVYPHGEPFEPVEVRI